MHLVLLWSLWYRIYSYCWCRCCAKMPSGRLWLVYFQHSSRFYREESVVIVVSLTAHCDAVPWMHHQAVTDAGKYMSASILLSVDDEKKKNATQMLALGQITMNDKIERYAEAGRLESSSKKFIEFPYRTHWTRLVMYLYMWATEENGHSPETQKNKTHPMHTRSIAIYDFHKNTQYIWCININ